MANQYRDDFAIVVGINEYGLHPSYRTLKGAVYDAQDFVDWLKSNLGGNLCAENIEDHYSGPAGERPRLGQIYRSIRALLKLSEGGQLKIGHRIYIFLAGHGVSAELDSATLLTADHSEEMDRYVPAKAIADMFREGGLFDEVLLFVDCCRDYVEELTGPDLPFRVRPDPDAARKVKYCYGFAANPYGKSFEQEFDSQHRGVFSWALMKGLRGGAEKDCQVTAGSLASYVKRQYGDQNQPDFDPKHPDLVLVNNLSPPRTEVVVTLREPEKGFEIRYGNDIERTVENERTQVADNEWRIKLRSERLYFFAVPASKDRFERSEVILVENERMNVEL